MPVLWWGGRRFLKLSQMGTWWHTGCENLSPYLVPSSSRHYSVSKGNVWGGVCERKEINRNQICRFGGGGGRGKTGPPHPAFSRDSTHRECSGSQEDEAGIFLGEKPVSPPKPRLWLRCEGPEPLPPMVYFPLTLPPALAGGTGGPRGPFTRVHLLSLKY